MSDGGLLSCPLIGYFGVSVCSEGDGEDTHKGAVAFCVGPRGGGGGDGRLTVSTPKVEGAEGGSTDVEAVVSGGVEACRVPV